MPQICPWDGFEPAAVHFCERELCAWVTQPANTWSNIAYIIVGIVILRLTKRENRPKLVPIGIIAILLGLGSMVFHASSTHFGEVIDVGAMYLFSGYAMVFNLQRFLRKRGRPLSTGALWTLYLMIVSVSITCVAVFRGEVGIVLFAIQAVLAGHFEVQMRLKHHEHLDYRPLIWLLVVFAVAWGIWWLDILKIVCDPDNHVLQGHAAWHVLNSTCCYFLYRFYAQLPPEPDA